MSGWEYTPRPSYVYARPMIRAPGRITTSRTEIAHIAIAATVLSVDIAIIEIGPFRVASGALSATDILIALGFGVAAALTGFVFHELAHKIAAQRRGYWAEFRMSVWGLVLSFITAVIGFLFAAPGATIVQDMDDPRDWGRTSLAGPATNLVEGGVVLVVAAGVFAVEPSSILLPYLVLLAFFNGWFATFNLIPIGPLDGRKVLSWNAGVWVAAFAASAALALATFVSFFFYGSAL